MRQVRKTKITERSSVTLLSRGALTKLHKAGPFPAFPRLTPEELSNTIDRLNIYDKWLIKYSTVGHLDFNNLCASLQY